MDKVLIVEDDQAIRESLQDILELRGYDVVTANNGNKGFLAVIKEHPILVICDVNMPEMGGFELLKVLNECMDKEIVPTFLFLTARATSADIRKGMELGADDYITKPFDTFNLLEIVKSKIEKRKKILSFAVVEEQNRISGELHDSIQQLLVASQMGFKSVKEDIAVLNQDTQQVFKRSLELLIEATAEVRNISHEISDRKGLDLKAKIEILFKQLKDAGEIETHFEYQVTKEFDNSKKVELLRIIQEAVNNVMKYSLAKNLFLHIESNENGGKIEIKDDGVGFDTSIVQSGNGITNMKNRAEKIGANFELASKIKNGTTIILTY
ncbi:MAG: hypothetical protein A3K10_12240 [Bacteroidetes bacterium RIFCSPLOWO2_12_FULL_31_6]|nr:MAG: hypothetical protein A3K10_12240 [Bacteroidetes bacterium RIFCSPLOWO2_12_FULL_31_6]